MKSYSLISVGGLFFLVFGYIALIFFGSQEIKEIEGQVKALTAEVDLKKSKSDSLNLVIERHSKVIAIRKNTLDSLVNKIAQQERKDRVYYEQVKQEVAKAEIKIQEIEKNKHTHENRGIIYVQTGSITTSKKLKKVGFLDALGKQGFTPYGFDLQKGKADNSIRYFYEGDAKTAKELSLKLKEQFNLTLKVKKLTGFENKKVPKRQLEIWVE